jgi:prepilin-type processing-associated H-X9-DG protein
MRRTRAFTLVELLVVIGIIVFVIGILMPVLVTARRRTQELSCVMNLRALGQAMGEYTRQTRYYPGYSPNYHNGGPSVAVLIWQVRLRQMMGGKSEPAERLFHCPAREDDGFDFVRDAESWPGRKADASHIGFGYVVGEPVLQTYLYGTSSSPKRYFSYGLNAMGCGPEGLGYYREGGFYQEVPARLVKVPSQMIAIAETQVGEAFAFQASVGPGQGAPHTDPAGAIHRGGTNVLFCDGHVMWHRLADITNLDGVDSAEHWSQVSPMWNASHRVR